MTASRIPVNIVVDKLGESKGELVRFLAPRTVDAIVKALPLEGKAMLWKEEVYFSTQIKIGSEKDKATVKPGTLAYWPVGGAFCIFYGASQPYSPVNVVGKITENLEMFKAVKNGDLVRVLRPDV